MVLLEFSISPTGKGESLSEDVAAILNVIDNSGVPYQLTPMGTILEGEWEEVISVVTNCFHEMEKRANRIGLHLKVDYRKGENSRLKSKMAKVENILGKELNK